MTIMINITGENMADVLEQIGALYAAPPAKKSKPTGVMPRADQPEVSDKNTGSSGSVQEPAIHSATPEVSSPPAPTESVPEAPSSQGPAPTVEPPSEATASSTLTKEEIRARIAAVTQRDESLRERIKQALADKNVAKVTDLSPSEQLAFVLWVEAL